VAADSSAISTENTGRKAGASGRKWSFGLFLLWDVSCEIVARTQHFIDDDIVLDPR
jgi:hypothetical protein